ncbi:MAG: hypothetical protein LQ340_007117 [Diploschistes diacapsis]|nr:MAG: hypothetical protein LQ340_007117 [Diploschistes diacapsis]
MTIVGRLGAEPEAVTTSSGRELVRYSIGTRHGPKDKETTTWWKVASFTEEGSRLSELLKGLPKGTLVYVEGEASMRKYERDGREETSLRLIQNKLEILRRPDSARSEDESQQAES